MTVRAVESGQFGANQKLFVLAKPLCSPVRMDKTRNLTMLRAEGVKRAGADVVVHALNPGPLETVRRLSEFCEFGLHGKF